MGGGLSFTQTSIFGRFGRALLKPLYTKLDSPPYFQTISDEESLVLQRRPASIRSAKPRRVEIKSPFQDVIIYTDAATSSAVSAALVIEPDVFLSESLFSATFAECDDPDWVGIFTDAALIYGLELHAAIAAIFTL